MATSCVRRSRSGWQVEVDAEPSRFVDFGNQVLDARLAAKWDAAYVFLGTNYLGDQQAYRKQLEKIVQRLSPSPVVLLTVTLFAESRREVNDAITLVGAEFPNVRVLDWGSIAAADATTILRDAASPHQRRAVGVGIDRCRSDGRGAGAGRQMPQHVVQQRFGRQRQWQRHAVEEQGRWHPDNRQATNRNDGRWRWWRYADQPAQRHGREPATGDHDPTSDATAGQPAPRSPITHTCHVHRDDNVGAAGFDLARMWACATDDWVARHCRSASCASAR